MYLRDFVEEKKKLSEKRMRNFISTEQFFLLPKHKKVPALKFNRSIEKEDKITKTNMNTNFDKAYDKIYKILEKTISNKKFDPETIAISQFESDELKKMNTHKKFLDIRKKFPEKLKEKSTQQSFLSQLLNFEGSNSVSKMMNRKFKMINQTLRHNETSSNFEKNKSI